MTLKRTGARRSERYRKSRGRRSTAGLVATITVLMMGAAEVQIAGAGTYVMRNCSVPGHANSSLGPWFDHESTPKMVMMDECVTGGGVGYRFVGPQQLYFGDSSVLALRRPTSGPQSQIKLVKVSMWYAARMRGSGPPLRVSSLDFRTDGTVRPWLITGAPGAETLSFEQQLSPEETTLYKLVFGCGPLATPAPPDPCVADSSMPFQVRGMEVTLSEDTPPLVSQPGGTLLAGGPQSGVRTLTYAASDPQSGLAKVDVLLGQTVIATDDVTTRCFYSDFTVCPASIDETLQIDTRAVANGAHRLSLRVRDAAGNESEVDSGRAIEVVNDPGPAGASPGVGSSGSPSLGHVGFPPRLGPGGAPPSPGSADTPPLTLAASFNGIKRTTLTVPYGRRVMVRGRLMQGAQPVAGGTQVEVLERLDHKGKREKATARVETKDDGSFSVAVATRRPSRMIRLVYRATGGVQVVSRALRLNVRAASRLRATLRGQVVRFSGRVLSGPIPARGKKVQMEGRSPGSAWTRFKILRTDRMGRFSGTYRLRVRRPGVVLKIRAVVPREDGYGYVSSRSRGVSLRVR